MITKNLLCWYKNGIHSVHLHTTRDTTIGDFCYIGCYKGQNLYAPMQKTTSPASGDLCVSYGYTYKAVDITPVMYVLYANHSHDSAPYQTNREIYGTIQLSTMGTDKIDHGSINRPVELQNSGNSWVTVLQLPAGGVVANLNNVRYQTTTFRLKIGSWTSSSFNLSSSSGIESRSIPEEQWGIVDEK